MNLFLYLFALKVSCAEKQFLLKEEALFIQNNCFESSFARLERNWILQEVVYSYINKNGNYLTESSSYKIWLDIKNTEKRKCYTEISCPEEKEIDLIAEFNEDKINGMIINYFYEKDPCQGMVLRSYKFAEKKDGDNIPLKNNEKNAIIMSTKDAFLKLIDICFTRGCLGKFEEVDTKILDSEAPFNLLHFESLRDSFDSLMKYFGLLKYKKFIEPLKHTVEKSGSPSVDTTEDNSRNLTDNYINTSKLFEYLISKLDTRIQEGVIEDNTCPKPLFKRFAIKLIETILTKNRVFIPVYYLKEYIYDNLYDTLEDATKKFHLKGYYSVTDDGECNEVYNVSDHWFFNELLDRSFKKINDIFARSYVNEEHIMEGFSELLGLEISEDYHHQVEKILYDYNNTMRWIISKKVKYSQTYVEPFYNDSNECTIYKMLKVKFESGIYMQKIEAFNNKGKSIKLVRRNDYDIISSRVLVIPIEIIKNKKIFNIMIKDENNGQQIGMLDLSNYHPRPLKLSILRFRK